MVHDTTKATNSKLYASEYNALADDVNQSRYSGSIGMGASYEIFKTGSNYYALNGSNGKIDYFGANAATVINAAYNGLTADRTWQEKIVLKGPITLSAKIDLTPGYVILSGGKLIAASGLNDDIIFAGASMAGEANYTPAASHITIKNMIIYGDRTNQTSGNGIYWQNVYKSEIKNCYISYCKESGIRFDGDDTTHGCGDNYIAPDVRCEYNEADGITVVYGLLNEFWGWTRDNVVNGIALYNSLENKIYGSHRDHDAGINIYLYQSDWNEIIGVKANEGIVGLKLNDSDENTVMGGSFNTNSQEGILVIGSRNHFSNIFSSATGEEGIKVYLGGYNTFDNIKIVNPCQLVSGSAILITGSVRNTFRGATTMKNIINSSMNYGFLETGSDSDYNIVSGCHFLDALTAGYLLTGSNSKVNLTYNGVSWVA